jgi:hypothetical protein
LLTIVSVHYVPLFSQTQAELKGLQAQIKLPPLSAAVSDSTASSGAKSSQASSQARERQAAVVKTFQWAWKGYKQYAWGKDELEPVSKRSHEWCV